MTISQGHGPTGLVAAYISLWNERREDRRRGIGSEIFSPDAYYVDPNTGIHGPDAIDAYVAGWQEQFPHFSFALGSVQEHHDVAHFSWGFGPAGGAPAATGRDVMLIGHDGIRAVYGFFNGA